MNTNRPIANLIWVFSLAIFCCLMSDSVFAQKKGSHGKLPKFKNKTQGNRFKNTVSPHSNLGAYSKKQNQGHPYQPGHVPPPGANYRQHLVENAILDLTPFVLGFGNGNGVYESEIPYDYRGQFENGYRDSQPYSTYQSLQPFEHQSFGTVPNAGEGYSAFYQFNSLTPAETAAASNLFNIDQPTAEPYAANEFFPQIQTTAEAQNAQTRAEMAFKNGDYPQALEMANQALKLDPKNGLLLLFASQSAFAVGDFSESEKYLNRATTILQSNQWGLVVRNFRQFYGHNDYVSQMDRLSQHIVQQPQDAAAWALRGFQYGSLRYHDASISDFEQALAADSNNQLANRMLPLLRPESAASNTDDIPAPVPTNIQESTQNRSLTNDSRKPLQIHGPSK